MPSNAIKGLAEKSGKSEAEVEALWDKAKAVAKEEYPDVSEEDGRFYGIVTGITKKMLGINEGFISLVESELSSLDSILNEMENYDMEMSDEDKKKKEEEDKAKLEEQEMAPEEVCPECGNTPCTCAEKELTEEEEMLTPEEEKELEMETSEMEKNEEELTKEACATDGKKKITEEDEEFKADADKEMEETGKEPVFGSEKVTEEVKDEDIFTYDDDVNQEIDDAIGSSMADASNVDVEKVTEEEDMEVEMSDEEKKKKEEEEEAKLQEALDEFGVENGNTGFEAGEMTNSYADEFTNYYGFDDLTGEELGDEEYNIALDAEIKSLSDEIAGYDAFDSEAMTGVDVSPEPEKMTESVADVQKLLSTRAQKRKQARMVFAKKDSTPEQKKAFSAKLRKEAQADRRVLEKAKAARKAKVKK